MSEKEPEVVEGQILNQEKEIPKELPKLTLRNLFLDLCDGIWAILFDPFCNRVVGPLIVIFSSLFTKIIKFRVPYTEIDFKTYIQQIHLINDGVIDYNFIWGDSGPIVYPAGFVQIYQFINYLTDDGTDIASAQSIFGYVFTLTSFLVVLTYTMSPNMKPWPLMLILLSKRLYSIYVLRLFNDVFTTISMVAVTLLLQSASYFYTSSSLISFLLTIVAADLYSIAISIKMNALLYLPAFIIIAYFLVGENLLKLGVVLAVIPFIQVMMGWKFLLPLFDTEEAKEIRWNYINNAFNFKRKFLYEWTVNWRFVGEEMFTSDKFATTLLVGHVSVLLLFIFSRFLSKRITGKLLSSLIKDAFKLSSTISSKNLLIDYRQGPKLIMLILSTTNVIGVLFSRSLHYQFLSWYCWQLPFLIYLGNLNILLGVCVWFLHEYCWNVFPSTTFSSATLVSILCFILFRVWNNREVWYETNKIEKNERTDTKLEKGDEVKQD